MCWRDAELAKFRCFFPVFSQVLPLPRQTDQPTDTQLTGMPRWNPGGIDRSRRQVRAYVRPFSGRFSSSSVRSGAASLRYGIERRLPGLSSSFSSTIGGSTRHPRRNRHRESNSCSTTHCVLRERRKRLRLFRIFWVVRGPDDQQNKAPHGEDTFEKRLVRLSERSRALA